VLSASSATLHPFQIQLAIAAEIAGYDSDGVRITPAAVIGVYFGFIVDRIPAGVGCSR
jgi:hypothetical protein